MTVNVNSNLSVSRFFSRGEKSDQKVTKFGGYKKIGLCKVSENQQFTKSCCASGGSTNYLIYLAYYQIVIFSPSNISVTLVKHFCLLVSFYGVICQVQQATFVFEMS